MSSSIYFSIGVIILKSAIEILEMLEEKYPDMYRKESFSNNS